MGFGVESYPKQKHPVGVLERSRDWSVAWGVESVWSFPLDSIVDFKEPPTSQLC
jgi:hypothetical protein